MPSSTAPAMPVPPPAAPARRTPRWLVALLAAISVAYPLVVWLALGHVSPRWIALLLVVLACARAAVTREAFWLGAAAAAGVLAGASFVGEGWGPLKLYPVLVNGVMLGVFGLSLWRGPSVVERLARLREPALAPAAVAYTRRVTQVWCGFFVANGLVALATALWASPAVWALYNGLLSYLTMGALMGGEWLVRRRVRARIDAAPAGEGSHG